MARKNKNLPMNTKSTFWKVPSKRVHVFPAAIDASRELPTDGNLVLTMRCAPMLPNVYTFDSPRKSCKHRE